MKDLAILKQRLEACPQILARVHPNDIERAADWLTARHVRVVETKWVNGGLDRFEEDGEWEWCIVAEDGELLATIPTGECDRTIAKDVAKPRETRDKILATSVSRVVEREPFVTHDLLEEYFEEVLKDGETLDFQRLADWLDERLFPNCERRVVEVTEEMAERAYQRWEQFPPPTRDLARKEWHLVRWKAAIEAALKEPAE